MYTLLLIDDEVLELEVLRDFINWKSLNIDTVLTASNGKDGLLKVEQYHPDIIITDIKMPVMSGIDFANELKNRASSSKIIFLSGYDDYQYVHNAYSCGGFDYLLKPFSVEEVSSAVLAVQENIEHEHTRNGAMEAIIRSELGQLLRGGSPEAISNSAAKLNAIQECWAKASVQLLKLYSSAERSRIEAALSGIGGYAYSLYYYGFVVLIIRNNLRIANIVERIKEYSQPDNKIIDGIIFSEQRVELIQLHDFVKKLDEYFPYLFYAKNPMEINIDSFLPYKFSQKPPAQIHKELAQEALFGSFEQTQIMIDEYFDEIAVSKPERALVIETVFITAIYFYENYIILNPELMMEFGLKSELLNRLNNMTHISQINHFLKEYILSIHRHFCAVKGGKSNEVVITAIRYIHQNFAKPVTIEEVAKEIYLSPNYVRTIFKEKTGKTILEFLTEYRMEKASELLREKQYKVKQVCRMVGYDNESYFCATFLKAYGSSPSEYRKKLYGWL